MSYLPLVILSLFFQQIGLRVIHICLPEGSTKDEVTEVPERAFLSHFCYKLLFITDIHYYFDCPLVAQIRLRIALV